MVLIWRKKRIPRGQSGLEISRTWRIKLDAKEIALAEAEAAAQAARDGITSGADPETGVPRPPVDGRPRGLRTGHLLGSIVASASGSEQSASAEVSTPRDRHGWLQSEAQQGRSYIGLGGAVRDKREKARREILRRALRGKR